MHSAAVTFILALKILEHHGYKYLGSDRLIFGRWGWDSLYIILIVIIPLEHFRVLE